MKLSGEIKVFTIILVLALVLVAIAVYPTIVGPPGPPPPPPPVTMLRKELIPAWSHMIGNPNAPYALVEFGDYQCPSCKYAVSKMDSLVEEHKDKMNYVFHYTCVMEKHVHALVLERAAEAAAAQGKFWEMHRKLFENQDAFENKSEEAVIEEVTKLAGALKLDLLKFRASLTDPATQQMADQQAALGRKLHIHATPAYYFVTPTGHIEPIAGTGPLLAYLNDPKHWQ